NADLGFNQSGTFSLASTETEFLELKKSANIMSKNNVEVEVLDALEIEKRLGAVNFVGGIKYLKDASINPYLLLQKMLKVLKTFENFKLIEGEEVFKVENCDDHKVVFTDLSTIETQIIVYATNGFSPLLQNYFKDKVFPTK